MDAKTFLAEFRHIASAPGGVQRLREMILSLAYQGKLCPHSDESAEALSASIVEQRARFGRGSHMRKKPDDVSYGAPYKIPDHWRWLSLGEIGHNWGQKTPADDFTYIDVSSIDNQRGELNSSPNVVAASSAPSRARKVVRKGDVIYSTVRPYLLNVAIIDRDFEHEPIASTAFAVLHPWDGVLPSFVFHYLRSPHFVAYVESVQIGMAYPAISDEKFFAGMMPVPPTEEQKRIVAKVDELMALCDKLEAQQQAREKLCGLVSSSVIEAIAGAQSAGELLAAWQRLNRELPLVIGQLANLEVLRNTILDLAAQGKLSEHKAGDSAASGLLEKAQASQLQRISAGEVRTKRSSPTDIKQVEIPLPLHWIKAPIEDFFQFIDYRGQTPVKTSSGRVLVTAKNVRPGKVTAEPAEYITEGDYAGWMTRGFPREGDLLITTEAPLGNVARIDCPPDFALAQRVIDLQPYAEMNTRYVMYFMMSPSFQKLLWENATGTTAKGIKAAKLKRLPLSVPPIEEQDRIVSRVENLLSICSVLEVQLAKARSTAELLARACTSAITGIRIEDKEDMKAPKAELVSRLRLGLSPADKDQAPLAALLIRNNGELEAKALWQLSGLEIDDFYRQLKTEMARGWIVEPEPAYVREVAA